MRNPLTFQLKSVVCVAFGMLIGAAGAGKLLAQSSEAPAYLVAEIDVHDAVGYKTKYLPLVSATFARFGAKYLAAGGKTESVAGAPPPNRVVILEFPSMEKARAWYTSKEYVATAPIRHTVATIRSFLVEGRAPQP